MGGNSTGPTAGLNPIVIIEGSAYSIDKSLFPQ